MRDRRGDDSLSLSKAPHVRRRTAPTLDSSFNVMVLQGLEPRSRWKETSRVATRGAPPRWPSQLQANPWLLVSTLWADARGLSAGRGRVVAQLAVRWSRWGPMIEKLGRAVGREARISGTEHSHADRTVELGSKRQFRDVLSQLGAEIDRGEALMKKAVSGGQAGLDAGDLIALQAGIYRYTEAVDLAAKLVDRAGSAVKTTLQGSGS